MVMTVCPVDKDFVALSFMMCVIYVAHNCVVSRSIVYGKEEGSRVCVFFFAIKDVESHPLTA
jgi:hypothetical protein